MSEYDDIQRELKASITKQAVAKFGSSITSNACRHLDEALASGNSWEKQFAIMKSKRNNSRSWFAAYWMYGELLGMTKLYLEMRNGKT